MELRQVVFQSILAARCQTEQLVGTGSEEFERGVRAVDDLLGRPEVIRQIVDDVTRHVERAELVAPQHRGLRQALSGIVGRAT